LLEVNGVLGILRKFARKYIKCVRPVEPNWSSTLSTYSHQHTKWKSSAFVRNAFFFKEMQKCSVTGASPLTSGWHLVPPNFLTTPSVEA